MTQRLRIGLLVPVVAFAAFVATRAVTMNIDVLPLVVSQAAAWSLVGALLGRSA